MPLSLLSDAYVSDSFNDAGHLAPSTDTTPLHFAALCRGVAVVVALALPLGLTLLSGPMPAAPEGAYPAPAQSIALRAKS